MPKQKFFHAFTMIELLIVIGMIGALAGVSAGVINIRRQQEIAQDASLKVNVEKVGIALMAYYEMENYTFPAEGPDENQNPINNNAPDFEQASKYITVWPDESVVYNYDDVGNRFSIYAPKKVNDDFYKFTSFWGKLKECGDENISDFTSCEEPSSPSYICGNNTCDTGEGCENCELDCGQCIVTCPNGVCGVDESCETCPEDCDCGGGDTCGDGICQQGETYATCPADCSQCNNNDDCIEFGETCLECGAICNASHACECILKKDCP